MILRLVTTLTHHNSRNAHPRKHEVNLKKNLNNTDNADAGEGMILNEQYPGKQENFNKKLYN